MQKFLFVILAGMVFVLTACGEAGQSKIVEAPDAIPAEYAGKSNPLDADSASPGADLFKSYCSPCHGESGHGDGPAAAALYPVPKNLAEFQTQVGDDYLFWRINTGKAGASMVAWKGTLTEEQIWQIITFLRTLK